MPIHKCRFSITTDLCVICGELSPEGANDLLRAQVEQTPAPKLADQIESYVKGLTVSDSAIMLTRFKEYYPNIESGDLADITFIPHIVRYVLQSFAAKGKG